jgi:hypothetical protein
MGIIDRRTEGNRNALMHGRYNRNALWHGRYTAEAMSDRKHIAELLREMRELRRLAMRTVMSLGCCILSVIGTGMVAAPDAAIHLVGHRLPAITHRCLAGAKMPSDQRRDERREHWRLPSVGRVWNKRGQLLSPHFPVGGPEQFLLSFRRRNDGRLRERDI